VDTDRVSAELAAELSTVAAWIGLEGGVQVAGRGDLAPALAATLPR
jgi:uncharacterized protein